MNVELIELATLAELHAHEVKKGITQYNYRKKRMRGGANNYLRDAIKANKKLTAIATDIADQTKGIG